MTTEKQQAMTTKTTRNRQPTGETWQAEPQPTPFLLSLVLGNERLNAR